MTDYERAASGGQDAAQIPHMLRYAAEAVRQRDALVTELEMMLAADAHPIGRIVVKALCERVQRNVARSLRRG